jgi:hypothetical protein
VFLFLLNIIFVVKSKLFHFFQFFHNIPHLFDFYKNTIIYNANGESTIASGICFACLIKSINNLKMKREK